MDFGTKVRTLLAVATCLNTALMATDLTQFHNATVDLIYRIASVVLNFIVVACVTWYNNDYTEAARVGTGVTRQIKAEMTDGYVGDYFFTEPQDESIEDEEDEQ